MPTRMPSMAAGALSRRSMRGTPCSCPRPGMGEGDAFIASTYWIVSPSISCRTNLAGGFALLLERLPGHQLHRLFAGPVVDVHALVEDRVGDGAQVELQLYQPEQRIVVEVSRVGEHVFGVDRPAF